MNLLQLLQIRQCQVSHRTLSKQDANGDDLKPDEKHRPSKRAKLKDQISQGRVLHASEVSGLGCKMLSEFLRAMGVKLSRAQQGDASYMCAELSQRLRDMGVNQWPVNS